MSRPRRYAGQRRAPVGRRFAVALSVIVAVLAGAIGAVVALLVH